MLPTAAAARAPSALPVLAHACITSRQSSSAAASSSGRGLAAAVRLESNSIGWRGRSQSRLAQRVGLAPAAAATDLPEVHLQELLKPHTAPTRRLSSQEAIDALYASQHDKQRRNYSAFYSSELGGITTDPALMVVQLDDHMVHRGHAVFDTALLIKGHLYQLDQHVERFLNSAYKANIPLPSGMSVAQMYRTIVETAATSCKMDGFVRYFLSAGRGGFGLSGNECLSSSFYCIVYTPETDLKKAADYLKGWKVKTSPVPIKAPYFTGVKSNNYLPNALNLMDAEAEGFQQGIFVDEKGNVSEGPNMNIACLLDDGTLVVPPFENALNGITVQRMMQLVPQAIKDGLEGVQRVEQRHITPEEAKKRSQEVFLVGSSLPVMPVVQWDDVVIGDGTPGLAALQLKAAIETDMEPRESSEQHVVVPYGYLTGMYAN